MMGKVESWKCGNCTNLCKREGYDGTYCLPMVMGTHKTEWQGDYCACLNQTFEPRQMEIVMGTEE